MARNQLEGFPFHTSQMDISASKVRVNGSLVELQSALLTAGGGGTDADFGIDFDGDTSGATDMSATLEAAIEAVAAAGGGVLRVSGTIALASTVEHTSPNVLIIGSGADTFHDVGSQLALSRTQFKWTGSAGGTMFRMRSPTGASAQKMRGGGIKGVSFYSASSGARAAIGLEILSWHGGKFDDLFFLEMSTAGLNVGVVATLGEARDTQYCTFSNIFGRNFDTTGKLLVLDGDATANTSLNLFCNIDHQHYNGDSIWLKSSDNNLFQRVRCFRAVGGSGYSIAFFGSDASATTARANVVQMFTCTASPILMKSGYAYAPHDNLIEWADRDNSSPLPVSDDASATEMAVGYTDGAEYTKMLVQCVLAATYASALLGRGLVASDFPTTASVLVNDSAAHMVFTNTTASRWWGVDMNNSTGNLEIKLGAGGGSSGLFVSSPDLRVSWSTAAKRRSVLQNVGVDRWAMSASADIASDFSVDRHDDAGTFVDSPLSISRSTGVATIGQPPLVSNLGNYANDAAASGGGVAVGQLYRNGSVLMVRVT